MHVSFLEVIKFLEEKSLKWEQISWENEKKTSPSGKDEFHRSVAPVFYDCEARSPYIAQAGLELTILLSWK